jgi:serine/threonine protein phosphatase PrpC
MTPPRAVAAGGDALSPVACEHEEHRKPARGAPAVLPTHATPPPLLSPHQQILAAFDAEPHARGVAVGDIGGRDRMEDAAGATAGGDGPFLWSAAIADGHGNRHTSSALTDSDSAQNVAARVARAIVSGQPAAAIAAAVTAAFREVDAELRADAKLARRGGSTYAFAAQLKDSGDLVVAHVGDSVALLVDAPSAPCARGRVRALTRMHRPTQPAEAARLARLPLSAEAAEAVTASGRIAGLLEVSRAFGDFAQKDEAWMAGAVTVDPDVVVVPKADIAASSTTMLFLLTDGAFDAFPPTPGADGGGFAA